MRQAFQLGHLSLYARNPNRIANFYQNVFGMQLRGAHSPVETAEIRLAFVPDSWHNDLSIVDLPNQVQITFFAGTLQDLENLYQSLRRARIPVGDKLFRDGYVSFRFNDPEGNRVEVLWPHMETFNKTKTPSG